MAGETRAVVVDTYAIMTDLTGQASKKALRTLEAVRLGDTRGVQHYLIDYELAYH